MIVTFTKPLYLLLLNIIPLVIFIHFVTLKRSRSHALQFANFDAIAKVKGADLLSKNLFILMITIVITVFLVFSVSGISIQRTALSSSSSFSIAIDTSESMTAIDISPNRFEAAKSAAQTFIDSTPQGTNMIILSFSGNALVEQKLTSDKTLLKDAVTRLSLSSLGGTDIAEAVITSTNLLSGEDGKSVIILSDGRINVGTIEDAIRYANDNDVIVHAIAVGTPEGGESSFGISKADEDALKALAYNTNGQFFSATNRDELQSAFGQVIGLRLKNVTTPLSEQFLIGALALLVIEYLLVNTRYRVFP